MPIKPFPSSPLLCRNTQVKCRIVEDEAVLPQESSSQTRRANLLKSACATLTFLAAVNVAIAEEDGPAEQVPDTTITHKVCWRLPGLRSGFAGPSL